MTPQQEAAAEAVTQELGAYSDQLVPGAAEQLGRLWGPGMANLPPDRRSEAIAQRMGSPLVDRWRDPGYDPDSAPTPLERALNQQGHRLVDGAAKRLASEWAPELAGRPAATVAGEVARRLDQRENWDHLRVRPEARAHEGRIYALLAANFGDLMTVTGMDSLARIRGREYSRMSDSQVIGSVAGLLSSTVGAKTYGTGATIAAGDLRLHGRGEFTTPARERTTRTNIDGRPVVAPPRNTTPPATPRDPGGRFTPGTTDQTGSGAPARRRSSF